MKFETDRDNSYLQHYGVPGQKWGVITKEYQPVAFDKRKLKKQQAIQRKMQDVNYRYGREQGDRVGNQFFQAARKRHAPEPVVQEKKPDIVDRSMKKAADHFGLGAYSDMAASFLKEQATNTAVNYVKSHAGETIKIGGKVLGTILSKTVGTAGKGVAWVMGNAGKGARSGLKLAGRGAQFIAKMTGKIGLKSAKWLTKGGGAKKIVKGARFLADNARNVVRPLLNTAKYGSRIAGILSRQGAMAARSGASIARQGAQALSSLLRRRS